MIDEHERTLWDAVLLVIKEANGRYGLKLYGHLMQDLSGFILTWVSENQQTLSVIIDHRDTFDIGIVQRVTQEAIIRTREIAETRDLVDRTLRDIRCL